jgi:zinc protease
MVQVFRTKLREIVREELGGSYGVWVRAQPTRYPEERYRISVFFGSAPERAEELTHVVLQEMEHLRTSGTTEKYLLKVKESQRREREKKLKENRFWLETLKFYDFHGEDFLDILSYDELVNGLTLQTIQKAAERYLDTSNYVRITLYPEDFVNP